ncbi:Iron-sulfur cluster assembly enzyme ISCU, mitochondrial [Triticum urartu]|uniref:Iron-sulfur cluster assembly enzyme ISCU, mitochondrial n=1 Tax=Triticum urartu TaxID=4572 RepID=M7YSJ2_TRIUA|nr:Iron-sulfur cluster assembly enzyme ISCU, mitochondrial [Triticum urartu]
MKLQIRVDEGTGKIVDACFKTFGCGSAIASSSVATEWVKGKQMEEVVSIKNTSRSGGEDASSGIGEGYLPSGEEAAASCEIAKHLSLPPVKLHCSMLAEDAIKAAVKDYESKKAKLGDSPAEKAAEA